MLIPYDDADDVEVWRCSAESQDVDEPSCHVIQEAKPTARQLAASAAAAATYGTSPSRGNFLPWAHLQRSGQGIVTRFSFPFVGEITPEEIHVWDVRTGALVRTMLNTQQVNYIDGDAIVSAGDGDDEVFWDPERIWDFNLTERYVFVCGRRLRVFDRSARGVVGMAPERAVSIEDIAPQDTFKWCFMVATDDSGEVIQKPHIEGALVVEHETVLLRYSGDEKFLGSEWLDVYAIDVFCRTQL